MTWLKTIRGWLFKQPLSKLPIMQIDIVFDFAKIFDVRKLYVATGQKFSFRIHPGNRLFSDNDDVLKLKVNKNKVEIEAAAIGHSTLLVLDDELDIKKKLFIRVVPSVGEQAGDLGLTADPPVPK